jgi:hypothetical protein
MSSRSCCLVPGRCRPGCPAGHLTRRRASSAQLKRVISASTTVSRYSRTHLDSAEYGSASPLRHVGCGQFTCVKRLHRSGGCLVDRGSIEPRRDPQGRRSPRTKHQSVNPGDAVVHRAFCRIGASRSPVGLLVVTVKRPHYPGNVAPERMTGLQPATCPIYQQRSGWEVGIRTPITWSRGDPVDVDEVGASRFS